MKIKSVQVNGNSQDPCKTNVNSLAACYLEHTLRQGKTIEIPSLGIVIKSPANDGGSYCEPAR